MSESVSEENDRRSSRKAAALFCLLLICALFSLSGNGAGIDSAPPAADPQPSLAAWSADFSGEQDVQELPRALHRGACRTVAPVKLKPRLHFPLRSALDPGICTAAVPKQPVSRARRGISAENPVFSAILTASLPVRAGPAAPLRSPSLPVAA